MTPQGLSYEPPQPFRLLRDGRRSLVQFHFTSLGEEVSNRTWERGRTYPGGGWDSPEFLADYMLRLDAAPGLKIFPDYDPTINVVNTRISQKDAHVASMDFGAGDSSHTAAEFAFITPKTTVVYAEWVKRRLPTRLHKERMRELVRRKRPDLDLDFAWATHYWIIGDCSGIGYRTDYADEPNPMRIAMPAQGEDWRNRDANESLLNSMFRMSKRCCYREHGTREDKCPICHQKLTLSPGLVLDRSCVVARSQIPAQVRDDEGKRRRQLCDAVDCLLYLARYVHNTHPKLRVKQAEAKSWWAPPVVKKSDPELEEMATGRRRKAVWF